MNLLLLTKFYPFGTGEAFIENEIKVMAEYYEKITIIACEVPDKINDIRKLPHNVTAYKISAESKKKDLLRSIIHIKQNDAQMTSEKKECKNIFQKIFLHYFEEKCQRIYNNIILKGYLNEIAEKSYDIYSYWLFTTARVGVLIANKVRPRKMYTRAHRYDLYEDKNKLKYLPYRKLFLKTYNNIFPCSDNGSKHIKMLYPELAEKVQTAFLGTLDYGIGKSSSDGVFRIVSCSRVEPVKCVDKIVRALSRLENENVSIEWTHIGDGSQYKKIKLIASRKLHNIKTIFCGNMKNTEIMDLYATHPFDLFINVSSSEGLPVSIMEAMSFGIPCIGTDVGGTSEIIIDGITGKLIASEFSSKELARIILDFAIHKGGIVSRSVCREYWEDHFQAFPNYRKLYEYIRKESDCEK